MGTKSLLVLVSYDGFQIEIVTELASAAYGRDRMFEDQLIDTIDLHDDSEPVEVFDAAGEFRPTDQVSDHIQTFSSRVIEKGVLYIWGLFLHRGSPIFSTAMLPDWRSSARRSSGSAVARIHSSRLGIIQFSAFATGIVN